MVGKVLGGVGLGHMEPVMVVVIGVCELWLVVANGWCVVVLELDVVGGAVVAGKRYCFCLAVHQFFLQNTHFPYLHGWFYKGWCTV